MTPVVIHFRGERRELVLRLGDHAEIAGVEPDFLRIVSMFQSGQEMRWPVIEAILACAMRPYRGLLAAFVEERGPVAAHALAGRVFTAALFPEREEEHEDEPAGEPEAGRTNGDSSSPSMSAPA